MYCRICGSEEGTEYRATKRLVLCDACNRETPRKASRANFERRYWGKDVDSVPRSTRDSFWSDYLTSCQTVDEYIAYTTEPY